MRRLNIRTWLVMALLILFALPLFIATLLNALLPLWLDPDPRVRLMLDLARSSTALADPYWQASARLKLSAMEIDLIIDDHKGKELFRSEPAPGKPLGPFVPGPNRWVQAIPVKPGTATFAGHGSAPQLSRPLLKRYLSEYVPAVAALGALVITLAGVAWFMGRAVLQPLAAMSQAARQIAAGELDFVLPDSRVTEVAEVAAAFTAMGRALGSSLDRQADLEQQRRMFISAIAHDLRTPLFALRGHLELFSKGLAQTPEKAARYLEICREKADALERLIADLFAYARSEYLREVPRRDRIDLGALLQRAVDGFRPLAASKGVTFLCAGSPDPCHVDGDAQLLMRAVENLLDNALRHGPPESVIHVAWQKSPNGVRFSVSDQGRGIAPDDLPHLFSPLFRGESSRNRTTGGAGLGLAIAQRILQAHGGDLSAANGASSGAVFSAVIPTNGV